MRTTFSWLSFSILLLFPSSGICLEQYYNILDTAEAYTIGRGNLQTEVEASITKQPDASELYRLPRAKVTYGLGEWADLEFEYEFLVVRDTDFIDYSTGKFEDDHNDAGTGDLRIKIKMSPFELGRHRLGVQGITKLPNADQGSGLGTDETDFTWQVLLSSDWGRLVTHLNAGIAILGDPAANANQNDFFVWGIGGEFALTEKYTLLAEIRGSTSAEHGTDGFVENIAEGTEGNARAKIRLGLTGPIGDWRWGIAGFKGLNSHTDDWGLLIGLSRIWGLGGSTEPATPPAETGPSAESFYNPMKTRTAYTIGERNFRADLSVGYVNQPDDSDLYILPDLILGWGIGPWADLRVEFQYLKVEDTIRFASDDAVIERNVDSDGLGDVRVRVKVSPFEFKYGRTGIEFVTKIPSADDKDALGTDEADFMFKGLLSTDWSDFFGDSFLGRFRTHLNAGMALQGDPQRFARQDDFFVWGALAEYKLTRELTLWSELEGSENGSIVRNISEGDYSGDYLEARLGLTGPLPEFRFLHDWKWGVTASAGLTDKSRDWTASVGISHTWGL